MQRTFQRLRAEFLEMPGLRLTPPQVQRLCGVDMTVCKPVLDALVASHFLQRHADGSYARLAEETIPPDATREHTPSHAASAR